MKGITTIKPSADTAAQAGTIDTAIAELTPGERRLLLAMMQPGVYAQGVAGIARAAGISRTRCWQLLKRRQRVAQLARAAVIRTAGEELATVVEKLKQSAIRPGSQGAADCRTLIELAMHGGARHRSTALAAV